MTDGDGPGSGRVVVLDDDPTGTQSAHGVTVLLDTDGDHLGDVLATERSVYVQTNSRALTEREAVAQAEVLRARIDRIARERGLDVRVVLRGDSTLRGHVFAESQVFSDVGSVMLFVPAFPDGGRLTRGGEHFVRTEGVDVPVGETEFARDPVFGFSSSDLTAFARERTGRSAVSVGLDALRAGHLAGILREAPANAVLVPDAVESADIGLIAAAVAEAWRTRHVVVRCAAPLAAELAGVSGAAALDTAVLQASRAAVVCGSHTDLARRQVRALEEVVGAATEIDTLRALVDPLAEGRRAAAMEGERRRPGGIRLITSGRDRRAEHSSLAHGAAVMRALTAAAEILCRDADAVVTKGGITASDVIRGSLGARRGRVLGQVTTGVSVWDVDTADARRVRVLIVPGNMGGDTILRDAYEWATEAGGGGQA